MTENKSGLSVLENVLYNALIQRGMNADIGVVEYNTKDSAGKPVRNSDEEKHPNRQKTSSDAGGIDEGVIYYY
jgi:hypothetical protein